MRFVRGTTPFLRWAQEIGIVRGAASTTRRLVAAFANAYPPGRSGGYSRPSERRGTRGGGARGQGGREARPTASPPGGRGGDGRPAERRATRRRAVAVQEGRQWPTGFDLRHSSSRSGTDTASTGRRWSASTTPPTTTPSATGR